MTANVKLAERLQALLEGVLIPFNRHAELSEIVQTLRSPSPAQGTYSIEDIAGWSSQFNNVSQAEMESYVRHPIHGIAAWKSKKLDAGGKS